MKVRSSGLKFGKVLAMSALAAGAAVVAPGNAHAAVHFYTSQGSYMSALTGFGYSDENVLFNDSMISVDGNPVKGKTQMTDTIVKFLGDVNLHPTGGSARLEAQNPPNTTYTDLTISLFNPGTTFKALAFNINPFSDGGRPVDLGTDTINLLGTNLDLLSTSFSIPSNGLTFFGVIADGTSSLDSVALSGNVGLQDTRQFEIGGYGEKGPDTNPNPTPEPCSMALLAGGVLPLLARLRRRNPQA